MNAPLTGEPSGLRRARGKVRVVHVSSAHPWSDNRIHLREAASLAAAGYDVHLVAIRHDVDLAETGVTAHLLPPRSRFARMSLGGITAIQTALATEAHLYHLHDPELFWAVPFLRALGKAVIYDAHEDLPSQVIDKEYLPRPLRRPLATLSRLALHVAGSADHVVAATERIATTFPNCRTSVVHNYPRLRSNNEVPTLVTERARTVVYIGVMSAERGTVEMIDAFASSAFPLDWSAVIAGTTVPASMLAELMERPGWQRVEYVGQVAPAEARDIVATARIGIVPLQRTMAYVESLPTKMFECFAEGVPVVASDFPLWRDIIERFECGLLVDETNPESIAEAVRGYAEDPAMLARHSRNALEAANHHFNWQAEEGILVSVYDRVALSGRSQP